MTRCSGTDSYRFSDGAVCTNRQVRGDLLEAAVWREVWTLLQSPRRLEQEFQRRLQGTRSDEDLALLQAQISKVHQTIGRLIDGYG
jgi:site-specific DNA recombinase